MAPSEITTEPDARRKGPRIEEAISNPGAVKINVKGAFIVDDEPRSRSPVDAEGVHYENKDIRLPHHTGVVSHVAVDVSCIASGPFFFPRRRWLPRTVDRPRNPADGERQLSTSRLRTAWLTANWCFPRSEDHWLS